MKSVILFTEYFSQKIAIKILAYVHDGKTGQTTVSITDGDLYRNGGR